MKNLPMGDSNSQLIDYKLSALAIELKQLKTSAGKECSLSKWCVIYLSFLICGRLLIREVHWFHWTQVLFSGTSKKNTLGLPMGRLELATSQLQNTDYKSLSRKLRCSRFFWDFWFGFPYSFIGVICEQVSKVIIFEWRYYSCHVLMKFWETLIILVDNSELSYR